ncbi:TPA: hypothetical protein HA371_06955, partial [Candidatus Woesearchaeota archaeon]|nr:hypothetical protein [Candidatus Woesearchaeota archaeon]
IHPDGQPYVFVYAQTVFGIYPQPEINQIKRLMAHELCSGLVYMLRSDDLVSIFNFGPPLSSANPSKTDTLMYRAMFSRDNGVDYPDLDWSRSPKNPWIDDP